MKDRRSLEVVWDDATALRLSARLLRENSRSSDTLRAELDGTAATPGEDIEIRDVRPVGQYGVNLVFSDGHDRGIYPWAYLRELAVEAAQPAGAPAVAPD
jgi:DUF971 family protein